MFISPECSRTLLGLSWLHLVLRFPKGAKTWDSHSKALARFLTWIPPLFSFFFPFLFLWLENIFFFFFPFLFLIGWRIFFSFFFAFLFLIGWRISALTPAHPHSSSPKGRWLPRWRSPEGEGFEISVTTAALPTLHFCSPPPHPTLHPGGKELLCPLPSSLHFVRIGPSWRPGEEHLGAFPGAIHLPRRHHCQRSGSPLVGLEQLWVGALPGRPFQSPTISALQVPQKN